jgi:hypothetical protein
VTNILSIHIRQQLVTGYFVRLLDRRDDRQRAYEYHREYVTGHVRAFVSALAVLVPAWAAQARISAVPAIFGRILGYLGFTARAGSFHVCGSTYIFAERNLTTAAIVS